MHLSEIWHSKKNDCRLSRTQVIRNIYSFHQGLPPLLPCKVAVTVDDAVPDVRV